MKKYILLLIAAVFLTASCTLKAVQSKKTFIINPQINHKSKKITKKIIRIKAVNCDSRFDSRLFFYRMGKHEFKPYAGAEWIESPCSMIKSSIINAITKNKMFKLASGSNVFIAEDYKLIFSVEDLEPVFEKTDSYILTNIHFTLINKDKDNVLNGYDFKEKIPIKHVCIKNIVNKINLSIGTALKHMFVWLEKDLNE